MPTTCFLPSVSASASATVCLQSPAQEPSHENVKIYIVGSKQSIFGIIKTLHRLGFAEINSWSKPQPTGNTGEFISVLFRTVIN